jgi:hypothetical protein
MIFGEFIASAPASAPNGGLLARIKRSNSVGMNHGSKVYLKKCFPSEGRGQHSAARCDTARAQTSIRSTSSSTLATGNSALNDFPNFRSLNSLPASRALTGGDDGGCNGAQPSWLQAATPACRMARRCAGRCQFRRRRNVSAIAHGENYLVPETWGCRRSQRRRGSFRILQPRWFLARAPAIRGAHFTSFRQEFDDLY